MTKIKKLIELLSPTDQKRAFLLIILIFMMAIFDVIGVASILPFMAVISNPQIVETNLYLANIFQISKSFGVSEINEFLIFLGVIVFVLLLVSLTFKALTTYLQTRFTLMCEHNIGKSLIKNYLYQPYKWFLNQHSADLGKSILSEVNQVIGLSLSPMLNFITRGIVSLGMIILLFFADPFVAIIVTTIFVLSYGIFFLFMKNFLFKIGYERVQANKDRFLAVSEVFNAVKEVKVGSLEKVFIEKFSKASKIHARNQALAQASSALPRFFVEGVAFGGMILVILFLMIKGHNFINLIPILTLYAFAGYRLIPSLQQMYASFSLLRFSEVVLNKLHNDIKSLKSLDNPQATKELINLNKSIDLKNIYFSYPNSNKTPLENVSLNIPAFTKVGVVGATGSGKTTLIDVILGLLEPSHGDLKVDGKKISLDNKKSWQKSIGYVPQQIFLADTSVSENIAYGIDSEKIDENSVTKAAKIANLHEFIINELPHGYNTVIGERGTRLSGGQRQRIGIARALYHNPQLLILDEATSSLDNITEKTLMKAIDRLSNKITIILIAHRLTTVKNCDIIFFLEKGKLKAQGSYNDLISANKKFEHMASI